MEHLALPLREAICLLSEVFICPILSSPHSLIENDVIIYCRTNHKIRLVSLPVRLYDVADTVPPVIFPLVSSYFFHCLIPNVHCQLLYRVYCMHRQKGHLFFVSAVSSSH